METTRRERLRISEGRRIARCPYELRRLPGRVKAAASPCVDFAATTSGQTHEYGSATDVTSVHPRPCRCGVAVLNVPAPRTSGSHAGAAPQARHCRNLRWIERLRWRLRYRESHGQVIDAQIPGRGGGRPMTTTGVAFALRKGYGFGPWPEPLPMEPETFYSRWPAGFRPSGSSEHQA